MVSSNVWPKLSKMPLAGIPLRQREAGNAQLGILIKGAAGNFNEASDKFSGAVKAFGKKMDKLEKEVVRDNLDAEKSFAAELGKYGFKAIETAAGELIAELKNLTSALTSPTATDKVKALTK